jgi:DNA-directed RNA polymerase subunit RPC12/RpoP
MTTPIAPTNEKERVEIQLLDPEALRLSYTCKCGTEIAINAGTETKHLDDRPCPACGFDLWPLFRVLGAYTAFLEAARSLPLLKLKTLNQRLADSSKPLASATGP